MTIAGPEPAAAPPTLEELFTPKTVPAPLLLLVVGPHGSGPDEVAAAGLELFRRGHVPLTDEAIASTTPEEQTTGEGADADPAQPQVVHPYARRLLERCDGVVRTGGHSAVADELVAVARSRGTRVWTAVESVPHVAPAPLV
ncbi:hypothetical protein [Nocardioides sp. SYSU D00065]|uniref:hypothetical protein n=1 Tax=Nocardioides sp. SYSU D00065 TaxID=2817378 RepID=UPI001B344C24|nr:hypothetical protein [Nocardioides sp. SYSU D00065]